MSLAMRELAQLYAALRDVDQGSGVATAATHSAGLRIMLPQLRGRFVQVQEVTARLERMLDDPTWSASLSSTERAFYELVLAEVRAAPTPKPPPPSGWTRSGRRLNTMRHGWRSVSQRCKRAVYPTMRC